MSTSATVAGGDSGEITSGGSVVSFQVAFKLIQGTANECGVYGIARSD